MLERYLAHGLPDPAQNTLWYAWFPFTNGMVYHVLAEQITPTFPKTPSKPRPTDGSMTYYPDTSDIDGLNCTFYESFDLRVCAWLRAWRKLVVDNEGNYGVPAIYKKEVVVQLYSCDDLRTPIKTMRYHGIFPTDQTPLTLSYDEESGRITVEAQFSADSMEVEEDGS